MVRSLEMKGLRRRNRRKPFVKSPDSGPFRSNGQMDIRQQMVCSSVPCGVYPGYGEGTSTARYNGGLVVITGVIIFGTLHCLASLQPPQPSPFQHY